MKGYTDFISGMFTGAAMPTAKGGKKYMDWNKAEKICRENPHSLIYAGLMEDWNNTSGVIFDNGEYYNGGILYDQSRWVTPILDVDGKEIECWTHEEHKHTGVPSGWCKNGDKRHELDEW